MFNISPFRNNLVRSLRNETLTCLLTNAIRGISFSSPLAFNITPTLMAMPQKKKRKIDPAIMKLRLERKRKKLEKEIRNYEKIKKTLKPIEEARMPAFFLYEKDTRQRLIQVPENVKEERILMSKEWTRYKGKQAWKDVRNITNIMKSQENALKELWKESVELYNAAIQIDPNLIPFSYVGPSDTPAIQGYKCPDGDYIDISKNWLQGWTSKK